MSVQGGLKHAATEPGQLNNKRERRARGATGRAAALRRVPSDSDCSGETASLSADSGERASRPPPPSTRTTKSRSRRRGSEWEVLEGLKDGQRFDKRPEVFNGYLHKKRKWPLKGWHKRFFVVDGGILVYARSPADVARGRLHGSVDVGLSVISAKQRRRRIDIDADEFIYHLRAKTPDVFRTWLTVLKAHRLYRQHLLTFGARESAPKVHAPLDDLPPTDASSRTSQSSIDSFSTLSSSEDDDYSIVPCDPSIFTPRFSQKITLSDPIPSVQDIDNKQSVNEDNIECLQKLNDDFDENEFQRLLNQLNITNNTKYKVDKKVKHMLLPKNPSGEATLKEQQMLITDLGDGLLTRFNTNTNFKVYTYKPCKYPSDLYVTKSKENETFLCGKKMEPVPTFFCFTRKKRQRCIQIKNGASAMRPSKKSTNLVKYRNLKDEPPLTKPLHDCLLLEKHKLDLTNETSNVPKQKPVHIFIDKVAAIDEAPVKSNVRASFVESEQISEQIIHTSFDNNNKLKSESIKLCISQIAKELFEEKSNVFKLHPVVKFMLKEVLEKFVGDAQCSKGTETSKCEKSVDRQSNVYFTKDQYLSNILINNVDKETQFKDNECFVNKPENGIIKSEPNKMTQILNKMAEEKKSPTAHVWKNADSFEKERRIQELETLLKNTIYVCDPIHSSPSREKDIEITKILINNLEKVTTESKVKNNKCYQQHNINKISSFEIPKIQETINHIISETDIPPGVAKEFLNAYLDVLLHDDKDSSSSQSIKHLNTTIEGNQNETVRKRTISKENQESKIKRVSKNIAAPINAPLIRSETDFTSKIIDQDQSVTAECDKPQHKDPHFDIVQNYINDLLNRMTNIFSKANSVTKLSNKTAKEFAENEINTNAIIEKDVIKENRDANSVVIDLSRYDLENVAMLNDPIDQTLISINIQLRKKPVFAGDFNHFHLTNDNPIRYNKRNNKATQEWVTHLSVSNSTSRDVLLSNGEFVPNDSNEMSYCCSLDASSKGLCDGVNETDFFPISTENNSVIHERVKTDQTHVLNKKDDKRTCFMVSSLKKCPKTLKTLPKRKEVLKDIVVNTSDSSSQSKLNCETFAFFNNSPPKVIDEKFILLLLENLSLLSKNLPTLHKDINSMYLKLKKKHHKMYNMAKPGLSLLGQIYNDEYSRFKRVMLDFAIQVNTICINKKSTNEITQTLPTKNKIIPNIPQLVDKCISALLFTTVDSVFQTDREVCSKTFVSIECQPLVHNNEDQIPSIYKKEVNIKHVVDSSSPTFTSVSFEADHSDNREHVCSCKYRSNANVEKCNKSTSTPNWCNLLCMTNTTSIENFLKMIDNNYSVSFNDIMPKVNTEGPIESESDRNEDYHSAQNSEPETKDLNRYEMGGGFNIYQMHAIDDLELNKSKSSNSDDLHTVYRCQSDPSFISESGGPLETASRELGQAQLTVQQLQRLLDSLELHQQVHHDTDVSLEGASPNVKKDRRKFGLRKKKSNSKCASVELAPPHMDPSNSHMALSTLTAPPSPGGGASSMPNSAASLPIACAAARPQSLPGAETLMGVTGPASLTSLTPDQQLREDFTVLAKDLLKSLKSIVSTLVLERGRLRAAMDTTDPASGSSSAMLAALRNNLNSALHQNSELRNRLSRIHDASDLAEISSVGANSDVVSRQFQQSLSYSSSCVSASEFFDAEEHEDLKTDLITADQAGVIELDGDSSSEAGSLSSEEGSASSDNSDGALLNSGPATLRLNQNGVDSEQSGWVRRKRLPCPRPTPGGPSLWNLLYKNIGKDLSQVSMPVTINEPLNMLQRLCEELEYSELLDAAAECSSSMERMSLIAAFAVSTYAASAHRAASKPFNPLLAETYECVRDDKGFRFIAEQVSHHPPISACHAESPRWCFWQEARIKTKFWGKSMEFQPAGRVHVRLHTTGDHYTWNKVTTCVHNLFGGQRWVDQYGDMHITCHSADITCKLNFIKASSWSSGRHEVRGVITSSGARVRLSGRWSEALYAGESPAARCLWRPGAMPPEHELYYGFTRFAMELNELEPGMKHLLPHTDTRLRPDQRALEEGDVESAERYKHQLEQAQRERRRDEPEHTPRWFRKACEGGEELWVFAGEYWKAREAGFPHDGPLIW